LVVSEDEVTNLDFHALKTGCENTFCTVLLGIGEAMALVEGSQASPACVYGKSGVKSGDEYGAFVQWY
jgi:hypothetical protein